MTNGIEFINNLEYIKIIKKYDKYFLKFKGWIIHKNSDDKLVIKMDGVTQYLEFNQFRIDVIDTYRTKNNMNFGFYYELEINKFNNFELGIIEEGQNKLIRKISFNKIEEIATYSSLNLENISIIKKGSKLFINLVGWVLHDNNNDRLMLKLDEKKEILEFNKYRKDVIDAYRINNDVNLGFDYELEVKKFRNLELHLIEDNNIKLLKKLKSEMIISKNDDLKVTFEKVDLTEQGNKINVLLVGAILNNVNTSKINIILKDDKNIELYRSDNFTDRKDIIKKDKEYKMSCGINININISKYVKKIQILIMEDFISYRVYEIDIMSNLNRSLEEVRKYSYQQWVRNNSLKEKEYTCMKNMISEFKYLPKISILMPVWNIEKQWLVKAIESIQKQTYENWELCIADDYSTKSYIKPFLKQLQNEDKRVKVVFKQSNDNISAATNTAFSLSTGEYILLMDHDDELTPNALFEIVKSLQIEDKPEIIYSDDDKIDENGNRYDPQFKPDWSPELLLSFMYISHIFCFKRELYEEVGGCRIGFEGCQDYDLALRMTELTNNIKHIETILYHWRSIEGSTARNANSKPKSFENAIRALQETLNRRNIKGLVSRPEFAKKSSLGIFNIDFPNIGPEVSIIIPTKNNKKLLERCINSIVRKTKYKNYKIVVINNASDEYESVNYIDMLRKSHSVFDIPNKNDKFSFAFINNEAVKRIDSEYILFLNNDTEVISEDWLSSMMGYAQIDGVGIVGSRLLFPNNRVQHAGVVLGLYNGMVAPAFKLLPSFSLGYYNFAKVSRNYSAVTAACMLIKKDLFISLDGFDDNLFSVAYNDVDLCIKCLNYGKRIVYTPNAELYHYEGASRGYIDDIDEIVSYKRLYGGYNDKYYNRNLSLYDEQFRINPENSLEYTSNLVNKKILFCTHNLNYEGAPLHLYDIVKGIKKKYHNWDITIITPKDGPLSNMYQELNVNIYIYPFNIFNNLEQESYNNEIKNIKKFISGENFDLIFANTLETFHIIDIANELQIPAIWNIHESVNYKKYYSMIDDYVRNKYLECFDSARKVIFVCESTLKLYNKNNIFSNFDYIYNGIDNRKINKFKAKFSKNEIKRYLGISRDTKVVSIVGTVCERKGQLDFVKAAINIIQYRNDLIFYVIGCRESSYLDEIKNIININNCTDKIILIEETPNVYLYYRSSDVFVCASYNESFPRVTLEAMAFDLPIVSTPVFGLKEQVIQNVNGLHFNPGDIKQLQNSIETILDDKQLYERLSNNSSKVGTYLNSYDEMLEKYISIIKRNI